MPGKWSGRTRSAAAVEKDGTSDVRKIIALLILVVLVVGVWTGAWVWARGYALGEMDRQIAQLAEQGVLVDCPGRSATGWPFRMEIACDQPSATMPDGRSVRAAAIAATLHIVDPRMVVVAVAAPVVIDNGHTLATADFNELRASARVDSNGTLDRVSVDARNPVVVVTDAAAASQALARVEADRAEAHLRPTPNMPDGFDLTATVTSLAADVEGEDVLPAPADAAVDGSLSNASLLDGTPAGVRAWALAGGMLTLREAVVRVGDTRMSVAGAGTVSEEGAATATFDATATDIAWLTAAAREGKPLPAPLAALGSAFLLLGRPVEGVDNARSLTIAVDDGEVTANGLGITTLPPLFEAGS
jgi:hypothetical protein